LTKEHQPNEQPLGNEKHKLPLFKNGKSAEVAQSHIDEKTEAEEEPEPPFELRDLMLRVPKGSFVAIVGRVGSGKVSRIHGLSKRLADVLQSSVLQALINEMPKTSGRVCAF